MGYIYFLLGGARSGKSSYAEELANMLCKEVAYIATAEVIDEEMQKRIDIHRSRRPATWKTFEFSSSTPTIKDFKGIIKTVSHENFKVAIIDCVTILLFRIIHKYRLDEIEIMNNYLEKGIEDEINLFFTEFIKLASSSEIKFIIVSNEVGMGVVPPYPLGRVFRDLMGTVNKQIAAAANEVYFFVAGIKQKIK
jgi:adenosylcobinamide kinase / adenosylcobinamide-phosphate guanylyltransferase